MNASANARLAFYVAVLTVLGAIYLASLALGAPVVELVGAILALAWVCVDVGGKVVASAVEERRRSGHHAPLELDATTPIDPGGPVGRRVREINDAIRQNARDEHDEERAAARGRVDDTRSRKP